MRKSGLTSGTMDHLRRLTAEKTAGLSLADVVESLPKPEPRREPRQAHTQEAPPVPARQAWEYKEPDSDRDIFMTVLNEESKDPMAEQSSKLLDDTLKDMRKGPGITPGLSPKRPKGMPKEPLKKDWTLRSSQRFLALLKKAYDIRNFYVEDSEGPQIPVSISASLNIPMAGSERGVNDLEEYVSDVISQALNLGGEHQLIVTAKNGSVASASGATPPPVSVNLEGFDPTKEAELRTLIEGLVVEAVSQFADSRGRTRA